MDISCEQSIDDGFVVNNVVHVQEMLKDVNVNIPVFTDDKEETIEVAVQAIRMSIVLLLMKHV